MKRKAWARGLLGFPLGVFIGYTITILVSLFAPDGAYHAVAPELAGELGGELRAVALQYGLCGLLGAACAAGSVVWEMERWSQLKMTVVHFLVISLSLLPTAYFMRWMERTPAGLALYFAIFLAIYAAIWLTQYLVTRRRVRQINEGVRRRRGR